MHPDTSQGETAYDRLISELRSGTLSPGQRLRETELAQRFGLSRTPIREAIRRLESDGFVEHRPRVGAAIRELGHSEVVELYEMRIILERTAAEMAAQRATQAEIDEIADLNAALADAGDDSATAADLNTHFHRCLHLAARNRFLLDAARGLSNALMLLGPTTLGDEERVTIATGQHARIIDALRAGDKDGAGQAAVTHMEASLRHRLKAMRR